MNRLSTAPQLPLLQRPEETLDDGDAAALADGPAPMADAVTLAPDFEARVRELNAGVSARGREH